MPDAPTAETVAALAKQAGLDLAPAYFEQLVGAYGNVRRMIDAIPHNRPRSDEPAHVFVPERFLPEGK
jgi:hypothetical protein